METKEIWPCRYANHCVFCCPDGNPDVCGEECYMTTDDRLKVVGICNCRILTNGVVAISYLLDPLKSQIITRLVNLINGHEIIDFEKIHRLCTDEAPGPVESKWPLVWTGGMYTDDDQLTFDFIERRDTSD